MQVGSYVDTLGKRGRLLIAVPSHTPHPKEKRTKKKEIF
jgi:hypothetical protein